jgi:HD-like signal output (HDOD) protein
MPTISRAALRQLPPIPYVCAQVLELATHETATAGGLAAVISADARMSLQLLRVANSALLRGRQPVTTVADAIVRIGMDETMRVAVACALLLEFEESTPLIGFDAILKHGLAVSRVWRHHSADAGTAGVLVDAPLLVMAREQQEFARYLAEVDRTEDAAALHALESRLFGVTRCEIARGIGEVWELPTALRDVLGGWHSCGRGEPELIAGFAAASLESDDPLFRALATR